MTKLPTSVCDDSHADHLRNDVQDVLAVAEAMAESPESRAHAAEVVKARLAAPAQGAAAAIAAVDERRAAAANSSAARETGSPRATSSPRASGQQGGPFDTGNGSDRNNIGNAVLKQAVEHATAAAQAMQGATTLDQALAAVHARTQGPAAGAAAAIAAAEANRAAAAQ